MTPKYWLKIILGMLAIFTCGMFVVKGVEAGKNRAVEHFVESADPITVPLLGMPFRTAKGQLGKFDKLRIDRSSPREIEGFYLTATLDEGVDVDQFDLCEVTVTDLEDFDEHTTFDCLTAANPGFDDLVQFGTITFKPSGESHRLMVPSAVRDQIRTAFLEDEEGAITEIFDDSTGTGTVRVEINGKNIVDIHGDSTGGHVRINDPQTGKTIVDVKASGN
jgi:hypothetical protein